MNYTALYRKYRPNRFEDVRGQDAIVRTLQNQLSSGRIGHAYLFTGTRGTGKTSIAKILARAVNCEHPVNGSPCNECATCRAILNNTSTCVVEVDAASNNGVENIRDLKDQVKYEPIDGKYRVYIIDEVHMMTVQAFNALLKTLEEPPSYVIFILATTEVHKVPITILSRCQRYDFRRISRNELEEQIRSILKAESIPAEEKAISYIARQADGSSRDALSLLERCVSLLNGGTLSYDQVLDALGAVDQRVFSEMLTAIRQGNVPDALSIIDRMMATGRELGQFVNDFIWYLRNILLVTTEDPGEEVLGVSRENLLEMKEAAREMDIDETTRYIRIFSELSNDLRNSTVKRAMTEIAVIRAMQPKTECDVRSLHERIRRLEEEVIRLSNGATSIQRERAAEPVMDSAPATAVKSEKKNEVRLPAALYSDYEALKNDWQDVTRDLTPIARTTLRAHAAVSAREDAICLLFDAPLYADLYERSKWAEQLLPVLEKKYGKQFKLTVQTLKPNETPPVVRLGSHIDGIEMEIQGGSNG